MIVPLDSTLNEFDAASESRDLDRWVEHLDRIPVCDFLPVLAEREALKRGSRLLSLSQWLNYMGTRPLGDITAEAESSSQPPNTRLAAATYLRWLDRVEDLLKGSQLPNLPRAGVVQYFVDHLAASVIMGYRRIGSTVQLDGLLAIPNPEAYLDPVRALRFAKTPQGLDLLRRSLYSRHKVLIQRNTLLHIDRERAADVFGPSIDTLFLNDWLHENRYARQRTDDNDVFFEDPVTRSATDLSLVQGRTFLEIGCGNGLLTASFARNEARIRSFAALDLSAAAVSATYENVATQRQLHGSPISARGRFIIGSYCLDAVPKTSGLVVCNPPYLPAPPLAIRGPGAHSLSAATLGTELLEQVVNDSASLIAPDGELLMISSALAEPEIVGAIPSSMHLERVASRRVPFDIEAIRGDDEEPYIAWLKRERGLETVDKLLMHTITIYRVTHSRAAAEGRSS